MYRQTAMSYHQTDIVPSKTNALSTNAEWVHELQRDARSEATLDESTTNINERKTDVNAQKNIIVDDWL